MPENSIDSCLHLSELKRQVTHQGDRKIRKSFRILEVKTSNKHRLRYSLDGVVDEPFPESFAHFDFFESGQHRGGKASQVTILLGQNGSGKSRLMRDIISIFNLVESNSNRVPMAQARINCVKYIKYRCNGNLYEIFVSESREIIGAVNHRNCSLTDILLPTRMIASSSSPFDKFPYPKTRKQTATALKSQDTYAYLGLKDRSGRASGSRALMNTIANLAEIKSKVSNVSACVSDLGLG